MAMEMMVKQMAMEMNEVQADANRDGNHGHAGNGDGNVAATSDRQWTWMRDMESEVLTSRKQFIKPAIRQKKQRQKPK